MRPRVSVVILWGESGCALIGVKRPVQGQGSHRIPFPPKFRLKILHLVLQC